MKHGVAVLAKLLEAASPEDEVTAFSAVLSWIGFLCSI
jgi:uncharacterized Zn finger protein